MNTRLSARSALLRTLVTLGATLLLFTLAGCYPEEEPCTPGLLNCQCTFDGDCEPGLECRNSGLPTCVDPAVTPCVAGTQGCPCRPEDSCDASLECRAGTCIDPGVVTMEGPFGPHTTCEVREPPPIEEAPRGYTKYIFCSGIPILALADVPDEALLLADETMGFMLEGLGEARAEMNRRGDYYVLRDEVETTVADLPEAWPSEVGMFPSVYSSELGIGTSGFQDLLCQATTLGLRPMNELVLTFAYQLAIDGLTWSDSAFMSELLAAFDSAKRAGIFFFETVEVDDPRQYFAGLAAIWWEVDADLTGPDANTRVELETYDPLGYALVARLLNPSSDVPGCVRGNVQTRYCEPDLEIGGVMHPVVQIGAQCWLGQNLATTRYADDSAIPLLESDGDWMSGGAGYAQYPGASPEDGLHYNFAAVEDSRGLCPAPYRVPSMDDTTALMNYIFEQTRNRDATHLRARELWMDEEAMSTDGFGFTARPSGRREPDGSYAGRGTDWHMWTTEPAVDGLATVRALFSNLSSWQVRRNEPVAQGNGVRCVRDGGIQ